jgi:hypothetical protein
MFRQKWLNIYRLFWQKIKKLKHKNDLNTIFWTNSKWKKFPTIESDEFRPYMIFGQNCIYPCQPIIYKYIGTNGIFYQFQIDTFWMDFVLWEYGESTKLCTYVGMMSQVTTPFWKRTVTTYWEALRYHWPILNRFQDNNVKSRCYFGLQVQTCGERRSYHVNIKCMHMLAISDLILNHTKVLKKTRNGFKNGPKIKMADSLFKFALRLNRCWVSDDTWSANFVLWKYFSFGRMIASLCAGVVWWATQRNES